MVNDAFYMRLAIEQAWQYQGLTYPNPAVGCAFLDANGKLLAVEAHKKAGYAHAELSALWSAVASGSAKEGVAKEVLEELFFAILKDEAFKFKSQILKLIDAVLSLYAKGKRASMLGSLYIYGKAQLSGACGLKKLIEIYDKPLDEPLFKLVGADFFTLAHNFIISNPSILYQALISRAPRLGLVGGCAYVSLEPCSHRGRTPPCANLLAALGLARVVIGTDDLHDIASGGKSVVASSGAMISYACKNEARELLEPFRLWQLGSGFKFAKLAISANGVVSGGAISGLLSRTHMHAIRSRLELLAVGGGTVRADMPKLDARLIDAKACDLAIFSRTDDTFNAPCFDVLEREVRVQNELKFDEKFIMFEGAQGLFNLISSGELFVDLVLLYQSSEFKDGKNLSLNLKLAPIYESSIGGDRYGWYKVVGV